jgi:hypothetical protein
MNNLSPLLRSIIVEALRDKAQKLEHERALFEDTSLEAEEIEKEITLISVLLEYLK